MLDQSLIQLDNISLPENLPLFNSTKSSLRWSQTFNPISEQYRKYGYLPNITIIRFPSKIYPNTWYVQRLVIQMSITKVLFDCNYFSADETDYPAFIEKLAKDLNMLGLPISNAQLELATLREIAFCFNFYFPDKYPHPIEYLKKMGFLDIGKRYNKVKNTDFIEEVAGYQTKLYNGQVGAGMYDKRTQLINDARTSKEFEILRLMNKGLIPSRVARLEIAYQNQTAVKQHLTTHLGGKKLQTRYLKDVFSNELAKAIIADVFEKYADDVNVRALDMPILPIENALKASRKAGMSQFEAEAWIGRSFNTQQVGSLEYANMLDRVYPRQRRYDTHKRYEKILNKHPLPKYTLGQIFDECRKQLQAFTMVKPDTLVIAPEQSRQEPQAIPLPLFDI